MDTKGELFCFGFASQLQSRAQFKPHSLYNKVKNNLKRLFFTQGSQTRNAKINQTRFSTLKVQVSVRQIYKFTVLQNDRFIKKSAEFN